MSNGNDEIRWQRERRDSILLVEYQKSQDSAEHHDTLLWTATGLIVTGLIAIFSFAANHQSSLVFPVLGMILSALLWFFVYSFASFRKQKYDRCKEIELELEMKQHSESRSGSQRMVVFLLSALSFIVWLLWLCKELSYRWNGSN